MNVPATCYDCGLRINGLRTYCDPCGVLHRNPKTYKYRVQVLRKRATEVLARSRATVHRSNVALAALRGSRIQLRVPVGRNSWDPVSSRPRDISFDAGLRRSSRAGAPALNERRRIVGERLGVPSQGTGARRRFCRSRGRLRPTDTTLGDAARRRLSRTSSLRGLIAEANFAAMLLARTKPEHPWAACQGASRRPDDRMLQVRPAPARRLQLGRSSGETICRASA